MIFVLNNEKWDRFEKTKIFDFSQIGLNVIVSLKTRNLKVKIAKLFYLIRAKMNFKK